ncbi:MAG: undecaprenyl/decaprenyl-phosphate alpha-N-acetylglucosaminyl 1-phosphate transferase [Actinobacteria bacterium]|nr:undecaprenyl/decaprenyl-phosphate alpha-N-acetylglucosaminyl 1-phosphate transferase [Actinomycetota bacterium]
MRDYLLILLVAAAVTYVLTPVVRRFATMVGAIKDTGRDRDVHTEPVPLLGGLAMYLGLAAGLLVANQIPQLRDAIAGTGIVPGLLGAGALLVAIGFIDDRWGLSAFAKGAGQVAAGGIVVATGAQLSWLPMPGGNGNFFFPTANQTTLLTILIVVATINAVNFIDGLDGLAAGIVAIAAISFFAYYYSLTRLTGVDRLDAPALASAILFGMCLGFLPHNFAPAKIFMGDTGAMLLGLVLAYAPIEGINSLQPDQLTSTINRYPVIMPVLLPIVLLVIPYGDMLLAVVRRTRAGQSPFVADRKHLHHRLLDIGHSQRASVLIMYLWAAVFSGAVVWLSITRTELPHAAGHRGEPVIVFVLLTVAAVAVLLLLSMPWRRWREQPGGAGRVARKIASGATPVWNGRASASNGAGSTYSANGRSATASTPAPTESELVGVAPPARSGETGPLPAHIESGSTDERTSGRHARPGPGDSYRDGSPSADDARMGNGLPEDGWQQGNGARPGAAD